jgi:hypothetical protein
LAEGKEYNFPDMRLSKHQTVTTADPNTWAKAVVRNDWGGRIANVQFRHRYDNDHMDHGEWRWLDNGASSEAIDVGYWTGFGRTGYDYWWVQFEAGCFTFTCKDDFYCFLTRDDEGQMVRCRVYIDGKDVKMNVGCPRSSACTVTLSKNVRKSEGAIGGDPAGPFPRDRQRPFYLIAHHCNAPDEIGEALANGANAIECDIKYDKDSDSWKVHHGAPDAYPGPTPPTDISAWLAGAKKAAQDYGKQFALIIFDNKSAVDFKTHGYQKFLDAVRAALPNDLNLLFSTGSYDERDDLELIYKQLRPNEGVAIDQDNDPRRVQDYFNQSGVSHFWYGNGIATFGPDPFGHTWSSLNQATGMRDQAQGIKKAYVWTLANEESIANYLSIAHVDGIMMNRTTLREAKKIINAAWDARLADRDDQAFLAFK